MLIVQKMNVNPVRHRVRRFWDIFVCPSQGLCKGFLDKFLLVSYNVHAWTSPMLMYGTFFICPLLTHGWVTLDPGSNTPAFSKCGNKNHILWKIAAVGDKLGEVDWTEADPCMRISHKPKKKNPASNQALGTRPSYETILFALFNKA